MSFRIVRMEKTMDNSLSILKSLRQLGRMIARTMAGTCYETAKSENCINCLVHSSSNTAIEH